jgi:hypothetical protein
MISAAIEWKGNFVYFLLIYAGCTRTACHLVIGLISLSKNLLSTFLCAQLRKCHQ